jgi:hypothetical protein
MTQVGADFASSWNLHNFEGNLNFQPGRPSAAVCLGWKQPRFLVTLNFTSGLTCAKVTPAFRGRFWIAEAKMIDPANRVERRVGQRFPYLLPVSIRQASSENEAAGFTQDLSSRGVYFFTDAPLLEGAEVELTLQMPSEITLGESMRVRCRGRVLRVTRPASHAANVETKAGVAVRFDGYEYLPESLEGSSTFARVSGLQSARVDGRSAPQAVRSPVLS